MDLPVICQIFPEAVLQVRCMMYINQTKMASLWVKILFHVSGTTIESPIIVKNKEQK